MAFHRPQGHGPEQRRFRLLMGFWLAVALFLLVPPLTPGGSATAAQRGSTASTPVRVQLKWTHQFQFAGYYTALAKGFFADAGLDVTLLEGGPSIDPATAVALGQADFGVGTSSLLIKYAQGMPLVAVAAFFQHSPFVILARRGDGIESVTDLKGRTLMLESHAEEILAYLTIVGVNPDDITLVPHTGSIRQLTAPPPERVDAMTAYLSTEPYLATRAGIPYQTFDPRTLGLDFYGDTLFTSRALADRDPALVKAMRDAVIKGWQYALTHQDEIVSLIHDSYAPRQDRVALGVEAQIYPALFNQDLVDIGYMSAKRWGQIADTFIQAGMITPPLDLDVFLFQDSDPLPRWVEHTLVTGLVALLLSLVFSLRIIQINRALKRSLRTLDLRSRQLEDLNGDLTRLSITDALTDLSNRRHFDDHLAREHARSVRSGRPLTLIMIDVDFFKAYNDIHGHPAGDSRLRDVAEVLERMSGRPGDLAARYGGEEFALVRPDMNEDQARVHANAILSAIRAMALPHAGSPHGILTASAGLATSRPDAVLDMDILIAQADDALYRAKRGGRDRVEGPFERQD